MNRRLALLVTTMSLCMATPVFSQAVAKYYLFEDSSRNLVAAQALSLFQQNKFTRQNDQHYNPGFTRSVFWLAVVIDSTIKPDSLRVLIGNPHINRLDLYAVRNNVAEQTYSTGDHFPYHQRPIETTKFAFPLTYDCYLYLLRVDKHNESLQLTYEVVGSESLVNLESQHAIITGLLTGMIVLLLIFGCYLAFITRKAIYIFYIVYVSSGWLWVLSDLGFTYKYLWPDYPWLASRARPVFSEVTIILSIQFLRYYIGGIRSNLLKKVLDITTIILVVSLLLLLAPLKENDAPLLAWIVLKLIPALAALYVILGTVALLSEVKAGNKMARFYLAALIPLMMFVSVNVLNHSGLINITGTMLDHYGVGLGYVIEIIVLTFGLAYQFNIYRVEKNRLQLAYEVQQKKNAMALIETEARERKRIADELHDIAGSMLSAARLNLTSAIESGFAANAPVRDKLVTANEALATVSNAVRTLSHALSPIMLQRVGFKKSVEGIASLFNTSGRLKVEVVVIGFEDYNSIHENVYNVLYGIIYEFLNNIVKHANASGAIIQLVEHDESITLSIEDNGTGLLTDLDKQNSKGIAGIISRIRFLNGEIVFDNTPGGLIITIEIPKEEYENTGSLSR